MQADARPEITLGNEVVRAFLHQFLWIDAAALGASCAMLGKLHAQTRDRTFDPASALQVVLHTLFGFVCAVAAVAMLPLGAANPMLRPVLGLAVGSAASAVDMMLVRLAEAAAVMFQQVDANARPGNRMAAAMAAAEQEQSEERIRIAGQLIGIQESITSGLARDQIADRLGRLARGLRASAEPNDVLYPRAS